MPYYGFNFLWFFSKNPWSPDPGTLDERELDFVAEEGFNFVRIPTDYHFWTEDFDYFHPNERVIEYLDRCIAACHARNLHVSLNLHRAPGYCINGADREKHNLWRDEEAQEGFLYLWQMFARRYQAIPSTLLSFDLVNEPSSQPTHPCTRDDHERVIRRTVKAIREIDPNRQIVIDGFDGGGAALPELADLGKDNVIHSGRGYHPFPISHFRAEWVNGSGDWPLPDYAGGKECRQNLREYYRPWRELQAKGVPVHIGEFGCYNKLPNDLALRWLTDLLTVYREFGWGYSLWNFRGMQVDRALLELLKMNRL